MLANALLVVDLLWRITGRICNNRPIY